jgi:hypothetical protein
MDSAAFNESKVATCHLEPGQFAYSKIHGPCVYLGFGHRQARDSSRSQWHARRLFNAEDGNELYEVATDFMPLPRKQVILDAIQILIDKSEERRFSSVEHIHSIMREGNILAMAGLAVNLHKKIGGNRHQHSSLLLELYDDVVGRIAEIATAHSLIKQRNNLAGAIFEKQPSHARPYFDLMRPRVQLALDGGIEGRHLKYFFFFGKTDQASFAYAAKNLAAKSAKTVVPPAAITAPASRGDVTEPQVSLPAAAVMSAVAVTDKARALPPFHYPSRSSSDGMGRRSVQGPLPPFHYPYRVQEGKPPQRPLGACGC